MPWIFGEGATLFIMELIEQLKQRRKQLGISNYKISQLTGIDKSRLSKIDSGKESNPTIETLNRIGKELGIELTWKEIK